MLQNMVEKSFPEQRSVNRVEKKSFLIQNIHAHNGAVLKPFNEVQMIMLANHKALKP